jgi:hypothetical protein
VEHKTLKAKSTTGKKGNMMRADKKSSRLFEYKTMLHNTKARAVEVTVVQLLPRSDVGEIEVTLLKPPRESVGVSGEGKHSDVGAAGEGALGAGKVMLNSVSNNVVFNVALQPHEKREIAYSYSVSWPHDGPNDQSGRMGAKDVTIV